MHPNPAICSHNIQIMHHHTAANKEEYYVTYVGRMGEISASDSYRFRSTAPTMSDSVSNFPSPFSSHISPTLLASNHAPVPKLATFPFWN